MTSHAITSASPSQDFGQLVATREAKVGIIGLGYAGLPPALAFCDAGFNVVGVDLNEQRVADVNARRSYLVDVPPGPLPGDRGSARRDGRLRVGRRPRRCHDLRPDAVVEDPQPRPVVRGQRRRGRGAHGRPGQLVVLQSTTHPGTTADVVRPIFERERGRVGQDFFLGYAPERVDPGNADFTIRTTPKLVAGVTDECLKRTALLYGEIVDSIVTTSSTAVAEMAKLHENTFRAVNIALANEARPDVPTDSEISAWEVIDAASTKPFGFLPHYPGPGLGGDCIPVVPHFLAWRMRELGYSAQLIRAAHEINATMPLHVIQKVGDALNDVASRSAARRILLAGVALQARGIGHARVAEPRDHATAAQARRRYPLLRPARA